MDEGNFTIEGAEQVFVKLLFNGLPPIYGTSWSDLKSVLRWGPQSTSGDM